MAEYEAQISAATDVDAPYMAFGAHDVLQYIGSQRLGRNQTTSIHPQDLADLFSQTANELGVTVEQLHAAANLSVVEGHCPSAELVMLWASKPFVVQQGIATAESELSSSFDGFAWMDAGGSAYKTERPPPNPWLSFWPTRGLAAKFLRSACHNGLGGRSVEEAHGSCIIGGILYGSALAWQDFTAAYRNVLRDRVLSGRGGLCAEQDMYTDVVAQHPLLVDRFEASGGSFEYGWGNAHRPS